MTVKVVGQGQNRKMYIFNLLSRVKVAIVKVKVAIVKVKVEIVGGFLPVDSREVRHTGVFMYCVINLCIFLCTGL